jgi:O-succinylbenzoic acid--CoA ligase
VTRPLQPIDARDAAAVHRALRLALSADGPAVLPYAGHAPQDLPADVPQRVVLVVETSGSTGRPKRVVLSSAALLASAAASESALGGPGQWLLALPAHYIAGLNVLVRSLTAQLDPVIMSPEGFTAAGFAEASARLEHSRRLVSLVPAQLARLLEEPVGVEALLPYAHVLVGGQSTPRGLLDAALAAGIRVTRTYGSSETSGGCVYDGVPIGDTEVAMVDGRVELTGSVLAEGYLDDLERNAAAFVERDGRRWYRTDDAGEIVDGVLRVTGRVDDVIVSGGVKISLGAVEEVVRSLPGLGGAIVVGVPHPQWGQVPVVVSEVPADADAVRAAVIARLGREAAPARIALVPRMPLLSTGKPDRLAAAAIALQ